MAKATGTTSLDLSYMGLTTLPPELFRLANLERLFLGNSRLHKSDEVVELLRNSGVSVYI